MSVQDLISALYTSRVRCVLHGGGQFALHMIILKFVTSASCVNWLVLVNLMLV